MLSRFFIQMMERHFLLSHSISNLTKNVFQEVRSHSSSLSMPWKLLLFIIRVTCFCFSGKHRTLRFYCFEEFTDTVSFFLYLICFSFIFHVTSQLRNRVWVFYRIQYVFNINYIEFYNLRRARNICCWKNNKSFRSVRGTLTHWVRPSSKLINNL